MAEYHSPVLVREVAVLAHGRRRLVDCTVGGGGHAARLLETGGSLLAIDRDPHAVREARAALPEGCVSWLNCSFAAPEALTCISRLRPDFVLFDLGVSTRQLEVDERGFSFRPGVPLDMRMAVGEGPSATDVVNTLERRELARVFDEYGDESRADRLAATIVRRRQRSPLTTSDDLVNAIRAALGPQTGPADFARLFQAVRITVNQELESLETALPAVLEALAPAGVIAVISYHSGEDRVVKRFFHEWARACVCPPRVPVCSCRGRALGVADPRKPIRPSAAEIAANRRARSAKLRVFHKSDAA